MDEQQVNKLKSAFLNISIDDTNEYVWIKQLQNIIKSDIHDKPLGCKISDTHIKIGDIHLSSFFEAEVLFSHRHWIDVFAEWLKKKIYESVKSETTKVLVYGYETYIESVLYLLKEKVNADNEKVENNLDLPESEENGQERKILKLHYCIYEEPRLTDKLGYSKTDPNIRYSDAFKDYVDDQTEVFYVCGVSTTLNTFFKMREKLIDRLKNLSLPGDFAQEQYFSIIQVLPTPDCRKEMSSRGHSFVEQQVRKSFINQGGGLGFLSVFPQKGDKGIDFKLFLGQRCVKRIDKSGDEIVSSFLASVDCEWYSAVNCPLCCLDGKRPYFLEYPIISTSETSVVPMQMIEPLRSVQKVTDKNSAILSKMDFFETKQVGDSEREVIYSFRKYLYYGHMERMDNHFIYYVKAAHLIKDILDNRVSGHLESFKNISKEIRESIVSGRSSDEQYTDIIVYTADFGDEVFANAVNTYVFDADAYMLSLDPKKEFRSNYVAKHSNIAYFLEQTKNNPKSKLCFHYVTKQLIGSESFSRTESLVKSLMNDYAFDLEQEKRVTVFSDVIVFLSRNSKRSKQNYVRSAEKYYSFIDIDVPSIRNYGDACPICKQTFEARECKNNSMLSINAGYWAYKEEDYKAKSIEDAKRINEEIDRSKEAIKTRYFRRFYNENRLWGAFRSCDTEYDYYRVIRSAMANDGNGESLISIIKVISSPFSYYRENEKKAALRILLELVSQYIAGTIDDGISFFQTSGITNTIKLSQEEQYYLLIVCLNCLAKINSTFILSVKRIIVLCMSVARIKPDTLFFQEVKDRVHGIDVSARDKFSASFYQCIANNCKRVICGISGESRAISFEDDIEKALDDFDGYIEKNISKEQATQFFDIQRKNELKHLLAILLIENSSQSRGIDVSSLPADIITKYRSAIPRLLKDSRASLVLVNPSGRIIAFDKSVLENVSTSKQESLLKTSLKEGGIAFDKRYSAVHLLSVPMNINTKSQSAISHMFMFFSFTSDAMDKDNLKAIRDVLRYRNSLNEIILPEIRNNSIYAAWMAEEARVLLESGKAIHHSGVRAIIDSLDRGTFLMKMWGEQKNASKKEEYYYNTCEAINLLMGTCISLGGTNRFIKESIQFSTVVPNNTNGFVENNLITWQQQGQTILARNNAALMDFCDIVEQKEDTSSEFFKCYLEQLINMGACQYWKNVVSKMSGEQKTIDATTKVCLYTGNYDILVNNKEKTKDLILLHEDEIEKQVIVPIRESGVMPIFIGSSSGYMNDAEARTIQLISLLDTSIRDALSHGIANTIRVLFSAKKDVGYLFKIQNRYDKKSRQSNTGLTKPLFKEINSKFATENGGVYITCYDEKSIHTVIVEVLLEGEESKNAED